VFSPGHMPFNLLNPLVYEAVSRVIFMFSTGISVECDDEALPCEEECLCDHSPTAGGGLRLKILAITPRRSSLMAGEIYSNDRMTGMYVHTVNSLSLSYFV
jgi:hypothetical protein